MSVKGLLLLSLCLFCINALFSSYSIKVLKEYSHRVKVYKRIKEDNLKLRSQIEKLLDVEKLEEYARRKGYRDFNWEDVVIPIIFEKKGEREKREGR